MNGEDTAIEQAQKFLEDILSFFGLNTVITTSKEDDVIELKVPSTHLNGFLIGQHGETLRALQALVSTMLKNVEADLVRVNIDIADYKQQRAERLLEQLKTWVGEVRETKSSKHLNPMNAADRRIIHRGLEDYPGITSHSEAEGRERHIVLDYQAD